MPTVTLDDIQARFPEVLAGLGPGESVAVVQDGQEVAIITRSASKQWPCKAGSARDVPHWMAPDFDDVPEEFREYIE